MNQPGRNSLEADPQQEIGRLLDDMQRLMAGLPLSPNFLEGLPTAPVVRRHSGGLDVQIGDKVCRCDIGYIESSDARWFYAKLRTTIIEGVDTIDPEVLNSANLWAVRSALVWDRELQTIFHHTLIYGRALGDEWFERWTIDHLMLQLGLAVAGESKLLEAVQKTAPSARRATTAEPCENASAGIAVVAAAMKVGQVPSRFGGTLESVLREPHPSLLDSLEAAPDSFRGVYSFPKFLGRDDTTLRILFEGRSDVTQEGFGSGLFLCLFTSIKMKEIPLAGPTIAMLLNHREAEDPYGANMNGAWYWHPDHGITHVSFLPSIYFNPGVAAYELMSTSLRPAWFKEVIPRILQNLAEGAGLS